MIDVTRVTGAADISAFHALLIEYERDLPPDLKHGTVASASVLETTYRGRNAAFLARREGEVAGCVAIEGIDAKTAVFMRLFVRAQDRGAGAARALATAAIRFAEDSGYTRVVLDTNKQQLQAAYHLYVSLGFTECKAFAAVTYACPTFMELFLQPTQPK